MKELVPISEAAPDLLERSQRLLAEAKTLDQVLKIRQIAIAARAYYQAAEQALAVVIEAEELKLEAESKAGEILKLTSDRGERVDHRGSNRGVPSENTPTLSELAVTRKQSHLWQKLAAIPKKLKQVYYARAKEQQENITAAGLLRIVKEAGREEQREQNRALVQATEPLDSVTVATCQTIVIDPPWDWGDEGDQDQFGRARPTYETKSFEEVLALPLGDLGTKNAHLYLWITNRSLPKGFALLEAWGFRYVTALTWCKPSIGMGNYFRGSTEHVLFGVRGSLPLLRNDVGTWFQAPRPGEQHSSKPAEFYALVETCSPGPWLEMFARTRRPGWAAWGAELAAITP